MVYVDLCVIVLYLEIFKWISDMLWNVVMVLKVDFLVICGVFYIVLLIVFFIFVSCNVLMVMRRKEVKFYGMKWLIEGVFMLESKCLVIEDVVISGLSVLEIVEMFVFVVLCVLDVVVLLDCF